jgi:hypothetical protein
MKFPQYCFSVYGEILEATLRNYRVGCSKPIQFTLTKYGDLFNEILQSQIQERLSPTDKIFITQSANFRNQAVMAVRRGEFAIAEELFAKLRGIKPNTLSNEASLLNRSFLEQAEAYLDYRRGDFNRVYTRTDEALAIDTVLEKNYGYEIMHIHRIQLLHNIVRTEARNLRFDRAIELAFQLLGYLEGTFKILPFLGAWGSEYVARQPLEVVAATFSQIISEIAVILAGKDRQIARNLLSANYIKLKADSLRSHPQAYAWIRLKQAYVDNNIPLFLGQASDFLAGGRADTPFLWYATIVDIVTLCEDLELKESEQFKQQVAKDAMKWEFVPERFFPLLGIIPKIN